MDGNHLLNKLLAAARQRPSGETVPYAFEKRVMARLSARRIEDSWALWGRALWRAAALCTVVSGLFGAWAVWPRPGSESTTLEDAVFAGIEQPNDLW
jgi:hypothetical protein